LNLIYPYAKDLTLVNTRNSISLTMNFGICWLNSFIDPDSWHLQSSMNQTN